MLLFFEKLEKMLKKLDAFFTPRKILFAAMGFGMLWGLIFLIFNCSIYRDVAHCYAWYARLFGRGYWNSASIVHLPPLNIFLGGLLARIGIEAYKAISLLSIISYLLTILPLFALLKRFLSPKMAAWGCFLYIMAPKIIRFSCMALLESTRDLCLVTSIYLLFRNRDDDVSLKEILLMGVSLALLALSRGEGILMAVLILIAFFIRPAADYSDFKRMWKKVFAPLILIGFTGLLVLSPRLIETWRITGFPVTDSRCIDVFKKIPFATKIFHDKSKIEEDKIDTALVQSDAENKDKTFFGKHVSYLLKQMLRGGYELYMILAVIGIFVQVFRRNWRWEYTFLVSFVAVSAFLMSFYSMAYRYFVFLIPLLMVFTMNGISFLCELTARIHLKAVLLLILTIIILIQPFNALGSVFERDAHEQRVFGEYIKNHRKLFLREGEKDRKLILYAWMLPEIVYWSDQEKLFEYGTRSISPILATGFDLLIIRSDDKKHVELLKSRKDLHEIQHPFSQKWVMFQLDTEKR